MNRSLITSPGIQFASRTPRSHRTISSKRDTQTEGNAIKSRKLKISTRTTEVFGGKRASLKRCVFKWDSKERQFHGWFVGEFRRRLKALDPKEGNRAGGAARSMEEEEDRGRACRDEGGQIGTAVQRYGGGGI